ncbi:MAG: hypothetical protein VKL42_07125 [Snowella sp.]|nr:hypothetical protein [Snowella sp.]
MNSISVSSVLAREGNHLRWLYLTLELLTFVLALMMACCTKIYAQASPMGISLPEAFSSEPTQVIPFQIELSAASSTLIPIHSVELTTQSEVEVEPGIRAESLSSLRKDVEDIDLMASDHQAQISKVTSKAFYPILEQSSGQTMIGESCDELANTADVVSSSGMALSGSSQPIMEQARQTAPSGFEHVNGRIDLVKKWNKESFAQPPSPVSATQTTTQYSVLQSPPPKLEQINGRVDLIEQWFHAQKSPSDDSLSFSLALEGLVENLFFPNLENPIFGDQVPLTFAPTVSPESESSPNILPPSRLSLPTAPTVPRLNPTQPGNIAPRDNRPLDTGSNTQELLNLVEESQNASPSRPPSYVPVVPKEQPQPPSPMPKESSVSPLPPNVPKEMGWQILDIIIENLITDAANKYPFLVNTSDLLTINPNSFNPQKANNYLNVSLDLDNFSSVSSTSTEAFSDPILSNLTMSSYPSKTQFYWILSGNRVVIETQGGHFNIGYQGRYFSRSFLQRATSSFGLFGQQAVFAIPQPLSSLIGTEKGVSFFSGVAQFSLPTNVALNTGLEIQFNLLNVDGQGTNMTKIVRVDNINKATTNEKEGGGSYFVNLDASNAPRFLQAFPTVNLQAFLANGLHWRRGETVAVEDFARIGITVGDPFSGQGFRFDQPVSSNPGLKTLQLNATDNNDLVRLLSNPFLSDRQRELYYLNSLMWYSGGQAPATIENIELNNTGKDWYQATVSWSHNRSLLTYDPENIELNYVNVFTNPGLSLTYTDFDNTDNKQILNTSVGLLLGGLFSLISPEVFNASFDEAHANYEQVKSLDTLKTKATSQERRAMNFRLNRTLQNASSNSALSQISGSYTFYGNTAPDNSFIMQIRSGLYPRAVSFYEQTVSDWTNPPWRISSARPINLKPLVFTGVNVPIEETNIDYNPVFTLGFVMATDQTGQVVFDQTTTLDRYSLTAVPFIGGRAATINFGRISFTRVLERHINTQNYQGYLYLPSLEFLLSGTIDDLSYSLSLGNWYNFYPQSAPGIDQNQPPPKSSITTENSLGVFFKGLIKADINNIFYDDNNQWNLILTHTPALSLNASTNPNRLNISSISLSYTLQLLTRDYGGSLTLSTSYSPQGLNAVFENSSLGKMGLFSALNFYHQAGWRFYGSLSLGDTSFYYLESTYDVLHDDQWGTVSIGPYVSNYVTATRGFNSQIKDNNYGGVVVYTLPNSGLSLRTRLGMGETGLRGEVSINGQIKF